MGAPTVALVWREPHHADAGKLDAGSSGDDYCRAFASKDFGCRSSGGGKGNRKVCFPVGPVTDAGPDAGADAALDADAGETG